MGSASSKDHDSNPHDLGQNIGDGASASPRGSQFPLQHHPQYGQSQRGGSDSSMNGGNGAGAAPYGQRMYPGDNPTGGGGADAMEVDQSSSETAYGISGASTTARNGESESSIVPVSDVVPMVFRWEHGGRNVYITGTFNGWSKQCPMHRSGNDFTYIANLTRGKHAYKFVVDEEWRFAPDQLTVADVEGNVNNFVDVSDFQALSDFDFSDEVKDTDENQYGRFIPDIDEYTKEPPPLPPHLRHIILNKNPPSVDTRLLPVPQHVALNHLYCTAIKDGMMVLGVTQRYKQKFVTTVYYSLMPGTS